MQVIAILVIVAIELVVVRRWLEHNKTVLACMILSLTPLLNVIAQGYAPGSEGFIYSVIAAVVLVLATRG